MQLAARTTKSERLAGATLPESSATVRQSQFSQHRVIRCNATLVSFQPPEISVMVDPAAATVAWDDGIRLDPDILYQGLLSGRPGKGFSSSGLAPATE